MADEFIERDAADPDNTITRTQWMEERLSDYKLDPRHDCPCVLRKCRGELRSEAKGSPTGQRECTPYRRRLGRKPWQVAGGVALFSGCGAPEQ